jgi:transcriptional regulator with GAF, ATPase, and Fis domain
MRDDHLDRLANHRLPIVARLLTSLALPEQVIEVVVQQGIAELGAEGGVVALRSGDHLVPRFAVGSSANAMRGRDRIPPTQRVPLVEAVNTSAPVWVPSRSAAERDYPDLIWSAFPDSKAWAALPLVAQRTTFGALGLTFLEERPFHASERRYLRALTDLAALALFAHPSVRQADPGAMAAQPSRLVPVPLVMVCAWCRRVRDDAMRIWLAVDPADLAPDNTHTHGMCPDCMNDLDTQLYS